MKRLKLIAMGLITVLCMSSMIACGGDDSATTSTTDSSASSSSSESTTNDTSSTDKQIYSQDVKIINNTGVEIYKMYVSASDKNEWEEDVLDVDTFPAGTEVNVTFEEEEEAQYWDLKVEDSEGTSITWTGLDLFTISELTLNFDSATGEATASFK